MQNFDKNLKIKNSHQDIHFGDRSMISTDNASVIDLSILLGIPFHSNLAQYQTVGLLEQELLIWYSCEHLHPFPLADARALFQ